MTKQRECGEKVPYSTKQEAKDAVRVAKSQHFVTRIGWYKCRHCGKFHIGHTPRKRR